MSAPSPFKQVCIVGGGNAAHALAALFPSKGFRTVWFAPYGDEAERIQAALDVNETILANFAAHNKPNGEVRGTPVKVSADPAEVIPESDVLVMPLPSFAYPSTLKQIKPFLQKGTTICVTPGQGGFEWTAMEILGDLAQDLTMYAAMPMPFNCRIVDFGKRVDVQTYKKNYRIGVVPESKAPEAIKINEALFGHTEYVGHFINCTLYPINAIIHPQRLYSLCKDWTPGTKLPENPLFYESMDEQSTGYMDAVNKELIQIADALSAQGLKTDVPHIYDFLSWVYSDVPMKNMIDLFAKNDAYKGFRCPFKQVDGGWEPDFKNRYFTEDIPLGLCIYKGVADIVGVETPMMDTVLAWAQKYMEKEYIVDGRLKGKDVSETTAPQRFGITTIEGLKGNHKRDAVGGDSELPLKK